MSACFCASDCIPWKAVIRLHQRFHVFASRFHDGGHVEAGELELLQHFGEIAKRIGGVRSVHAKSSLTVEYLPAVQRRDAIAARTQRRLLAPQTPTRLACGVGRHIASIMRHPETLRQRSSPRLAGQAFPGLSRGLSRGLGWRRAIHHRDSTQERHQ